MASHSLLLQSHHHCLLMRFGSAAMARILADFDISELKVLVKGEFNKTEKIQSGAAGVLL